MPTAQPATSAERILEYERRRRDRRATVDALERDERVLSVARLLLFVAAVALLWRGVRSDAVSLWWSLLPLVSFMAVVVIHARRIELRKRRERTVRYYDRGLARVTDDWMGAGDAGSEFASPEHPYSTDLDVFGVGSLFERLSVARTEAGRHRLAEWLTTDADEAAIRNRTGGVAELSPHVDLKEDLAVLGEDAAATLHPDRIRSWASSPDRAPSLMWSLAAIVVAAGNVLAAVTWTMKITTGVPFLIMFLVTIIVHTATKRETAGVVANVGGPARELELVATLAARFRRERFQGAALGSLLERLDANGNRIENAVRGLTRRAELVDSMRNPFFGPIAFFLLWPVHVSAAIERWRARYGPSVPDWLDTMADIEAYASIATYAWENPEDVTAVVSASPVRFEATALGHPLLPRQTCRRNDVRLSAETPLLVVSGSNMSGKSTLLRTIGVTTLLARVGAPVRAGSASMSPMHLGASLRTQDSLLAGKSRFYAEIERLRLLVELAGSRGGLLFLIDEILQGTNSHDRRIGAQAVLQSLVESGAIGLATTHDLALTEIADSLGERARNVHFADDMVDGVMVFDYRLRDGVVRRSNALALMRSIGIRV